MGGKYGDLIRQARQQENQNTSKPDNQKISEPTELETIKPNNQNTSKPDSQKPTEPTERKTRKPDNQQTNKQDNQKKISEPEVNLCVKVPRSLRQHWAAEAKRKGTTMTAVIIEALTAKFGKPDSD
ncbi:MAG: hypothetical protein QNJ54_25360 [Prochloraceae cyanobacterium]|nr:hypothetical protein [Prochloraceae cyanobacterium]